MKLNNHVPHKIKKRIMKKADASMSNRASDIFWRNVRYYDTIKKVKSFNPEAGRYLEKRLRHKGIITYNAFNNAFTGLLMCDFEWGASPQGNNFWSGVDYELVKLRLKEKISGS